MDQSGRSRGGKKSSEIFEREIERERERDFEDWAGMILDVRGKKRS